jgi:hypothetical protein
MTTRPHATATSIHLGAVISNVDPGAQGGRKLWVDTSSAPPFQLKVRNAGDTGWDVVGSVGGQAFPPVNDLSMGAFKLTNLAAPVADTDAADKSYVDVETTRAETAETLLAGTTLDAVPAPVANVTLNGHKATGAADPTAAQDLATKHYVDTTSPHPWDNTRTYHLGDLVTFGGYTWVTAAANSTNNTPDVGGGYWTRLQELFVNDFHGTNVTAPINVHFPDPRVVVANDFGDAQVDTSAIAPSDVTWTDLTLQNGYVNAAYPGMVSGFRKDGSGFIHLQGGIDGTSSTGAIITQLPANSRPLHDLVFAVGTLGVDAVRSLIVHADGTIIWQGGTPLHDHFYLNGIDFLAEQ